MANIKVNISDQQAGTGGLPMPRISGEAYGAGVGDALDNAARTSRNIAELKRQREEEQENLAVAKADAMGDSMWAKKLEEAKANAAPGAPGFAEQMEQEFSDYRDQVLTTFQSPRARQKAEINLERLGGHIGADSIKFEAMQRVAKTDADIDSVVGLRRNAVQGNPSRFGELLQQSVADVQNSGLRGDKLVAKLQDTVQGMSQSAAQGMIELDPKGALDTLQKGAFDEYMKPETKAILVNQAQAAIKQQEAIARQASGEARIAISSVKDRMTQGDTIPAEEMAYVSQTVSASNNPQLTEQFNLLQQTQALTQNYSKMSPQQLQNEVIDLRAKASGSKDGVTVEMRNQMDVAEQTLNKMISGVRDDRMTYASRAGITDIGSITDGDGNIDPIGIKKRMAASDMLDQHFGFRGDVLTKPEADAFVNSMNTGSVDEQLGRARAIAEAFGPRAMDVFAQVDKKDPSIAYIGGLAVDNPEVARKALEGRKLFRDNPKGVDLGENVQPQITATVRDTLKDILRFNPKQENAVRTAALDIYRFDASRNGTASGSFDDDMYATSLRQAVDGNIAQVGAGDTIVPKDISADDFNDLITKATPEMLTQHSMTGGAPTYTSGKAVDPSELKDAIFYPVYDGQYAVKGPNGFWLAGPTLYIFDVRKGAQNVGQP